MPTILPSGEEVYVTPEEILRYLNADGLRQLLRQERLHWNLKPNKDADYYSKSTNFKYSSDLHNEGDHQRMEVRTFPDNGANPGYAGVSVDGGEFGITHNRDKWDHAISEESKQAVAQRVEIGVTSTRGDKSGYGLEDDGTIQKGSNNREATIILDSYDGRGYILSNDEPYYVNNEKRSPETRLPLRTIARIADIPTRITDLDNDLDFVSDWDYHHTSNSFTNSNRYVLDNLDDRTFVYPEISKDINGNYISNTYVSLVGNSNYAEGDSTGTDGGRATNSQPEVGDSNDRQGAAVNSYNKNKNFSGNNYPNGYFPGVFRSLEELEKVDLLRQKRTSLNSSTPGGRRRQNYYQFDGLWDQNAYDRDNNDESYLSESHNPANMESNAVGIKPTPFNVVNQDTAFNTTMLYQWRYNRVTVYWEAKNIVINVLKAGVDYKVGDLLRYTYADEVLTYQVDAVGPNGEILSGHYILTNPTLRFEQDPSTNGVGIPFTDYVSSGKGALLTISCKASIYVNATQIKNNLYAYVDVVPTVRSDNTTKWSDVNNPSTNGGVVVRSTAPSPAYSGINSGRGGEPPSDSSSENTFYEHGGNATAGPHIHLFRYVINTTNPTWEIVDGVKVYTGKWVDCGPLGLERPADIKALLFSNPDCNNFNNYYKFALDIILDTINRNPDSVITNNNTALSSAYVHIAQSDPKPEQRFYIKKVNPITSAIENLDVTNRVLYINAGTRVVFFYNAGPKNDPTFGYGSEGIGWIPLAGTVTK